MTVFSDAIDWSILVAFGLVIEFLLLKWSYRFGYRAGETDTLFRRRQPRNGK